MGGNTVSSPLLIRCVSWNIEAFLDVPYADRFKDVFGSPRWFDEIDILLTMETGKKAFNEIMKIEGFNERFSGVQGDRPRMSDDKQLGQAVFYDKARFTLIGPPIIKEMKSGNCVALLVRLRDEKTGNVLWVSPVHLSSWNFHVDNIEVRQSQIQEIITVIEKERKWDPSESALILAGDFNEPLNYRGEGQGPVATAIRKLLPLARS